MSSSALPPDPRGPHLTSVLECIECGLRSDVGRGWRAYLSESRDVCIYCADCAAREFGES